MKRFFEWVLINLMFWGGFYGLIFRVPDSLDQGELNEYRLSKLICLLVLGGGIYWAYQLQKERETKQREEFEKRWKETEKFLKEWEEEKKREEVNP